MKIYQFITTISVFVSLAFAQTSDALDIPYGGDAMLYQLRNAENLVAAEFQGVSKSGLDFKLSKAVQTEGKLQIPAQFSVPADDGYIKASAFKKGTTYLLFLKALKDQTGLSFRLSTSFYSAHAIDAGDVKAVDQFAATVVKLRGDKTALKKSMLAEMGNGVPYLQYSALIGFTNLKAMTAEDFDILAQKIDKDVITEERAKTIALTQLGRSGNLKYASTLEQAIKNPRSTSNLQSVALDGLIKMGATQNIARIAPIIENSTSYKLKRKYMEHKNPRAR